MSIPEHQEGDHDHWGCELANNLVQPFFLPAAIVLFKMANTKFSFIFKDAFQNYVSQLFFSLMWLVTEAQLNDTTGTAIHMVTGAFTPGAILLAQFYALCIVLD